MKTFKQILYLILLICVLQSSMFVVEGAITTGASNSEAGYMTSNDKTFGAAPSILGSIYHKSRQLRCATCHDDRRYGEDRTRYYGSYSARSGDDRASSWYYPSYDRYDDRGYRGSEYDRYGTSGADRYGADPYGADKYGTSDRYAGYRDDHYSSKPSYDRYDSRSRIPYERLPAYDRGESRGYGYDNRDRYYGSDRDYYGRDRYYERPRYAATAGAGSTTGYGGYDRDSYDRYSPRYDYRHYRPWDDKYRSYTGYSYAKTQEDRRYLPETSYNSRCVTRRPNCPYSSSSEEGTRVTSGTIDSGHYNAGISQTNYYTGSNTNRNESRKGLGSQTGWSYMREDDQPSRDDSGSSSGKFASKSNNSNRDRDRDSNNSDQQSSGYGALLDRGTNLIAVEPIKSNENGNDQLTNANVEETPKQSHNEQNS